MQILKYLLVATISATIGYGLACMMLQNGQASRQEELKDNLYQNNIKGGSKNE